MVVNDSLTTGVCNYSVVPFHKVSPSALVTSKAPLPLVTIKPEYNTNTDKVMYASHWPKYPPSPATPQIKVSVPNPDMATVSAQLRCLEDVVASLWDSWANDTTPLTALIPTATSTNTPALVLLSSMSMEEIVSLVHHDGSALPSVRPCDTANESDSKMHWTAEEIHRTMGYWKFRNYRHLLLVSSSSEWVDGGEFPSSLGSFAIFPKAKHGLLLDCTRYRYLDVVHMDIMFGNCLSVGGFFHALILVD
jgi:hypothetical protein